MSDHEQARVDLLDSLHPVSLAAFATGSMEKRPVLWRHRDDTPLTDDEHALLAACSYEDVRRLLAQRRDQS